MLAYKFRFHGHGSLRYLFAKGQTARSRNFMIRYVPNKFRPQPRITVIISKKVFKSAVKRNRIRRRVYEIVRHDLQRLGSVYDITITVFSPEVISLPYTELRQELERLFLTADLFTDSASAS